MFSTPIERALQAAVAAHDDQVRSGLVQALRSTRPLHVALMLARWGQDEEVIVAGLVHGIAASCGGWPPQRVEQEFGRHVAALVGELTGSASLESLARMGGAAARIARLSPEAATIKAVELLHEFQHLLAELRKAIDAAAVWSHYTAGPEATLGAATELVEALGRRVEPKLARALGTALRAISDHERADAVRRAS